MIMLANAWPSLDYVLNQTTNFSGEKRDRLPRTNSESIEINNDASEPEPMPTLQVASTSKRLKIIESLISKCGTAKTWRRLFFR